MELFLLKVIPSIILTVFGATIVIFIGASGTAIYYGIKIYFLVKREREKIRGN
jgi:hypothetical protein